MLPFVVRQAFQPDSLLGNVRLFGPDVRLESLTYLNVPVTGMENNLNCIA